MPNDYSTIGFDFETQEQVVAITGRVVAAAEVLPVGSGRYIHWCGRSGEELWLQVNSRGETTGSNPHFKGRSVVRVWVESRVHYVDHTELDGAFRCWADPVDDEPTPGVYPFVFDAPDAAAYRDLAVPGMATAQVAAFAREVSCYPSEEAFFATDLGFAPRSFFAAESLAQFGLEPRPTDPCAMAMFSGYVVEGGAHINELTGIEYYWALVDTLGGTFDVVIDRRLLPTPANAGCLVQGWFWLSGRLTDFSAAAAAG